MRRLAVAIVVAACAAIALASFAPATVIRSGNLQITLLSQVQPRLLPRVEKAPIAVFLSGHVASVDKGVPPQLRGMTIDINRHGSLDTDGLPTCDIARIRATTSARAVENCGPAVIGSGQFWAHIVFTGQDPYPTHGRLVVFNGKRRGAPALLVHIYTANPFKTSFVIPFQIRHLPAGGAYGLRLSASLPQALGTWGYVDRIKLTLRRKYRHRGETRSFFNANCPAAPGTRAASFQLAEADFTFGDEQLSLEVQKSCGVKGK